METEHIIIGVNLALFLVIPYLPDVVFHYFVDSYLGAAVLLAIILYSITYGYLVAVSTFSSMLSLYVESHKRKVENVKGSAPAKVEVSTSEALKSIAPAPKIVPTEVHPDADLPDGEPATFVPSDTTGSDEFESVDTKEVLPTVSLSKDVITLLEKDSN
jgi:hypothetical protein